jgi:hypothetical protein
LYDGLTDIQDSDSGTWHTYVVQNTAFSGKSLKKHTHEIFLTYFCLLVMGSDSLKTSQAQSILRKLSKIDLDQAKTLVENDMRSAIKDGDKLS